MLLLRVLSDESRTTLRMHHGLIRMFIAELRAKTDASTASGRDITRSELTEALLAATGAYQKVAVEAIAAELARDYAALESGAAGPLTMERGTPHGERVVRLLPS
jgi:hypothetical protein